MIRVLKSMGAKLAMAAFVLMTGGQALAAGSLAIDTLQGEKYGFSFNHPASDQADQRAMRECGPDCAVVLRFGGGCHGCGMVDVTLKNGVEKTLRERIPEITEVRDATDHETGDKPYFARAAG